VRAHTRSFLNPRERNGLGPYGTARANMADALSQAVQWLQSLESRGQLLLMIGLAMAYVGWQMLKLLFPKDAVDYDGDMDAENRFHGHGRITTSNGDTYTGSFVHGRIEGEGEYVFSGGGRFKGAFVNGQYNGAGEEWYPDGTYYKGAFVSGRRHGLGMMRYPDGTIYEGEWRHGQKEGKGKLTTPSGSVFTGTFVQGRRHGRGEFVNPASGARLVADYFEGTLKRQVSLDRGQARAAATPSEGVADAKTQTSDG
jgi:hypothetical protein